MFDLKRFREDRKIKQGVLAEQLEVQQPFISRIESGKDPMPDALISKLMKKYDLVDVSEYTKNEAEIQDGNDWLPLIPFECMAGFGEDNSGIILNDCEIYNIPEFKNIGAEFLVSVGGSSMYPKYSSGDILACKKIHERLFYQWGKVYVIDSSQGQLIKRVFEHENPDMILLVSDNKEKYQPFSIPKSDIRSLGIVLGVVRME